ncbi:unnamed protein product [Closterium sp. NIES-54]
MAVAHSEGSTSALRNRAFPSNTPTPPSTHSCPLSSSVSHLCQERCVAIESLLWLSHVVQAARQRFLSHLPKSPSPPSIHPLPLLTPLPLTPHHPLCLPSHQPQERCVAIESLLWLSHERCVAIESLLWLSHVVQAARQRFLSHLPKASWPLLESYTSETLEVVPELCEHVMRTAARLLINFSSYADKIAAGRWESHDVTSYHSPYVRVCHAMCVIRVHAFWSLHCTALCEKKWNH